MLLFSFLTHNYATRGFWGDEAWTALISQFNLGEIIRITSQDFHPPLYYFIVHFWIKLFGTEELAIRSVSTLFFILTVFVGYIFAQALFQKKIFAFATAALLFTGPILTTYAFEARSYGLVILLSALTTYFFWRAFLSGKKRYQVLYIVSGVLGLYTHYYTGFLLAAHLFSVLIISPKRILRWIKVFAVITVGYLLWVPVLLAQITTVNQDYWIGPINKFTHYEFYLRLMTGEFESPQRSLLLVYATLLVIIGIVVGIKRNRQLLLFLLSLVLIPVIMPTVISFVMSPIFFYRYLIFLYFPLSILMVWAGALFPKIGKALLIFLIGLQLSVAWIGLKRTTYSMREAMQKIKNKDSADTIVTFLPSFAEVVYYNRLGLKILVSSEGLVQFSGKSLLDAYIRHGKTKIIDNFPEKPYWLIQPGPKVMLVTNKNEKTD